MDFNAILAFNNQLNFQTAFGWDVTQIHAFLNKVVDKPDDYRERDPAKPEEPYPDPNPERRKQNLSLLRDELIALTPPNGGKYTKPVPEQSILRDSEEVQLAPTQKIEWQVNNNAEQFYIIFDLLGIFLSIIGPAPTNATTGSKAPTAQNYFLPLVVVHAKWCSRLVGGGSGFTPTVAQVTWARQDDTSPYFFFLGTSAKGWFQPQREKGKPPPSNVWQPLAQKTRHEYMFRLLEPKYQVWGASPEFTARGGRGGWNFGNCGETYPFLYLINDGMPAKNIFGIALNIAHTAQHEVDWAKYWGNGPIKPPCQNCSYLIERFNALVANFTLYESS